MFGNPEWQLDGIDGYQSCVVRDNGDDGYWRCVITTQRDGATQTFEGTGVDIYHAIQDAAEQAKQ